MAIRVTCPNGHVLEVKEGLAGKVGRCPVCNAKVKVPLPSKDSWSEDDVISFLDSPDETPKPHTSPGTDAKSSEAAVKYGLPKKACTKCNREIAYGVHICPFCHTYIANLSDVL